MSPPAFKLCKVERKIVEHLGFEFQEKTSYQFQGRNGYKRLSERENGAQGSHVGRSFKQARFCLAVQAWTRFKNLLFPNEEGGTDGVAARLFVDKYTNY